MSSTFRVARHATGEIVTLEVAGEVDMGTSPRLLELVERALATAPVLKVALKEVDYMDSSGVAVLVQGQRLATRRGRIFCILDPSPQVLAVIHLARLQQVFAIEHSQEPHK